MAIEFPWWLGLVMVFALTTPAGAAGAAALAVWLARRWRDAVAWCVLGYLAGGMLSVLLARTLLGGWGRDRTVEADDLFWTSVVVGVVLLALAAWGAAHRRG